MTGRALVPSLRLRTVALAALFGFTTFFVSTVPAGPRDPRPEALAPAATRALACADGPSFEGHLTNTSATTAIATYSTTGNVFGYISEVVDDWSCTAWYRYDGLTWSRTADGSAGNFMWGNLINSTTVACNWVIGETNYLKANSTTDCPDSDAEYAMAAYLGNTGTATLLQGIYHNDTTPDEIGDFAFVHSDCESYYGPRSDRWNQPYSPSVSGTRPGANCDPYVLESTNTTQTVVVDATAPVTDFTWPNEGTGPSLVTSAFAGVSFDATDNVAGFDAASNRDWDLQRQKATWSGSACGSFSNDTTSGNLTSGTTDATGQVVSQGLADATCYRWTLAAKDANNNTATTITSGSIRTDLSGNLGTREQHTFERWDLGAGDALSVNVGTGNLVIEHPVLDAPIRGGSFAIDLIYNRHDTRNVGMGPGWRLDVFRRLTVNGDGSVTYTDGDGSRHTFTNPSGTTIKSYTRPATLYATLTRDTAPTPDRFSLTWRDGAFDAFDELATNTGYLVREEDRHGNAMTFTYDGSQQLTRIEDPISRDIDLAWTSGKLTRIEDWAYVDGSGVVQTSASGSRRATRFFYSGADLRGWADPLAPSGDCTAGGSHITCLTVGASALDISKTQRYAYLHTTPDPDVINTSTRTITSSVAFTNADVVTVRTAQEVHNGTAGTAFSHTAPGQTQVVRRGTAGVSPDTTSRYTLASSGDAYARVSSVARKLGSVWITTATAYHGTYPIEVASVTEDRGGSLQRTVTNTWSAGTIGPNLTRVVEPLTATDERWTDHVYNANHDITETRVSLEGSTDPAERTITRYCYGSACNTGDAGDDLLRVIENYVDKTAGGANGHVEDVTVEYLYDSYGQRTRETRQNHAPGGTLLDSRAIGYAYDSSGNLTAEIVNDVSGTVTDPGDDITPNATTNARTDLTTTHTYDTAGNRASTADPRRAIETAKGTSLAADDFVTRWTYDALGQRLSEKTPTTPGITISQRTAATAYDELGAVRSETDFAGQVTATAYDRVGRVIATFEDPDGAGSAEAARQTGSVTVDPQGREIERRDERQLLEGGLGSTTTTYDELGRQTVTTEADGTADETETRTAYDALDRRTSEEPGWQADGSHQTTIYRYDIGGRITETDDEFTCIRETFDYRDLATGTREGLTSGGSACTGSGTRRLTHSFDGLGRLTQTLVAESSIDATEVGDKTAIATFDAAGNQRTSGTYDASTSTTLTTTITTNPLDQPTIEVRPDGSVAKTNFDPAGHATDRCLWASSTSESCQVAGYGGYGDPPESASSTGYDARNNRVSLLSPTAGETTYDPDADYQVAAVYLPTGAGTEHQTLYEYWPERHTLKKVTHRLCTISTGHACSSTQATGSAEYSLDANDNRTTVIEDPTGGAPTTRHYCHDALDQLAKVSTGSASCASGVIETNAYDAAGNRTSTTGRTFSYDDEGRLTGCSPSCGTVTHDAAGRLVHYNGWYLWYDPEHRLVRACETSGCTTSGDQVTFTYDGDGRRTRITSRIGAGATTTINLLYGGATVAAETNAAGTVTRTYVTDETGTIVKVCDPDCSGSNPRYLVTWNGHGDAQALWRIETSGALTLANSYTYSTWGVPTTTTHNGVADLGFRFLYVGRHGVQWDDFGTGLATHYMQARHYVPALGRFLQPDPSRLETNAYGYAENSPVSKVDPSGTLSSRCWELLRKIVLRRNELARRWAQIRANKLNLPMYGRMSIAGHRNQFRNKQANLRDLLGDFWEKCGRSGGPKPPSDCWKWATRPAPKPAPKPSKSSAGAGAGGAILFLVSVWWGLKILSPACGPAAPVCALAL